MNSQSIDVLICLFSPDEDECTDGTADCHATLASCNNTLGGYECDCLEGYDGDGVDCGGKSWIINITSVIFMKWSQLPCNCLEGYDGDEVE